MWAAPSFSSVRQQTITACTVQRQTHLVLKVFQLRLLFCHFALLCCQLLLKVCLVHEEVSAVRFEELSVVLQFLSLGCQLSLQQGHFFMYTYAKHTCAFVHAFAGLRAPHSLLGWAVSQSLLI